MKHLALSGLLAGTVCAALACAAFAAPFAYVPNEKSGSISIIDTARYRVLGTLPVGRLPGHVRFG